MIVSRNARAIDVKQLSSAVFVSHVGAVNDICKSSSYHEYHYRYKRNGPKTKNCLHNRRSWTNTTWTCIRSVKVMRHLQRFTQYEHSITLFYLKDSLKRLIFRTPLHYIDGCVCHIVLCCFVKSDKNNSFCTHAISQLPAQCRYIGNVNLPRDYTFKYTLFCII